MDIPPRFFKDERVVIAAWMADRGAFFHAGPRSILVDMRLVYTTLLSEPVTRLFETQESDGSPLTGPRPRVNKAREVR